MLGLVTMMTGVLLAVAGLITAYKAVQKALQDDNQGRNDT